MASGIQPYVVSHTGQTLGDNAVTRQQNQVDPQRPTDVLTFECPRQFESVRFRGSRDAIRFVPRTVETVSGDGATTSFEMEADIQPVAGEEDLDDQDYPAVRAVEVGSGEVEIADVDYATNELTLANAPADGDSNVKLYPIITDAEMKLEGINALDQREGTVFPFAFPCYRFHDVHQTKRGTEITLPNGSITWKRNERLAVQIDSPTPVVWEDEDYPEAFVSSFEMDVRIEL